MRSISCTIISFVLFYMALNCNKSCWKTRVLLGALSIIMLAIAFIFMVFGI